MGCGTGTFLLYAYRQLNIDFLCGIDISEELINHLPEILPEAESIILDIRNTKGLPNKLFDVCTCLGVLSIFDDLEKVINNLLSLVKNDGYLIVYNFFNVHPIDVKIRYKFAEKDNSDWRVGVNNISTYTYEQILSKIGGLEWDWINFSMPFKIEKKSSPMRAWTMKTEEDNFQLTLG